MSFLWPMVLWLAALVLILAVLDAWLSRRGDGKTAWPQIRRGVAAGGRVRFDSRRAGGPPLAWRFWLALLLVVLALARPQWGQAPPAEGDQAPGEVIIALDLSRSMLAADVSPTRLARARSLATRLAEDLPDRRIGLIGFAGTAHLLAPVSEDRAILAAYLPQMGPEHMPVPGSDFSALLDLTLASFSDADQGRVLVILTDGEAEPGAWRERLADLRARNVRIIAVGLGTEAGATPPGPDGQPLALPSGAPVVSRLTPAALSELASATGGQVVPLAEASGLTELVRAASLTPPDKAGAIEGRPTAKADQFAWFALAALALLVWSAAVEIPARPRLRQRRAQAVVQAALVALLALAFLPLDRSLAQAPLLTEADLQGEEDPLVQMRELAEELIAKPRLGAADHLRIAEVATRYGEIHRGHGHALEDGVMRDGLMAARRGRAQDPDLADWAAIEAKLERLLVPPPPAPMEDPGPADPANEPMGAQGQQPVAGEDARDSGGDGPPEDQKEPTAGEQGLQNVGGSQEDVYDPAEWSNPALVQPLDELRRLRAADSPAELFQRLRAAAAEPRPPGAQTW
ncbi:VWA domain-containing protein [Phenylobacterium sp.]|uniref:vWA domain-containing protein n=1 Tax=Phenylobacterium sp. TaxID=1871053 RepID=UPI00272F3BD9|nr:VWA domain-containing protein [Phenylobacterium sp.]MDP1616336.1 VWA domain-containing protein [Phenylobacterium sp.]MDP1988557.1 VWA domain-containing protein [Phenylobacterium sp.]